MKLDHVPRLGVWRDLLGRYRQAVRHAWRERRQFDPPPRERHEAQFLPAALELVETPVSPAPRWIMRLIVLFALLALLWASFGRIDIVATAHGKIVPNDRTKLVQPIETAAVKSIRVRDGQAVKAGDVLMELDATTSETDAVRLSADVLLARLQAARSRALLQAIDSGGAPVLSGVQGLAADRVAQEQRILDGQYAEFKARLSRIDADIQRREAERRSVDEAVKKLEQTAPIARRKAEDMKGLVEKNFVSRHVYLEREQVRIEQEGDLEIQRNRLKELAAAILEGRAQRESLIAETRRVALESQREAEQRKTAMGQELVKTETRGRLMTLTAPVDGTIQQLAVHTVGGVVTPAQVLAVLVPSDHALEVEAALDNKDVGFVNAGQSAEVKVETFPFTKYGTIRAEVVHVSTDAINDEKRGLIYAARVRLAKSTIPVEDKVVRLSPGMAVTVEIKTGTRRVIEYFLSPLLQHGQESLRER